MKISALFGAGSVIDLGAPSTKGLTEFIRDEARVIREAYGTLDGSEQRRRENANFINEIGEQLDESYPHDDSNFEEIFHVIETLISYEGGWREGTVRGRKPPPSAFLSPRRLRWFEDHFLLRASQELRRVIFEQVLGYESDFLSRRDQDQWYFDFWKNAVDEAGWEIATTNYDTCIQEAFADDFTDGFYEEIEGISRFRYQRFVEEMQDRPNYIFNLHGCINFGFLPTDREGIEGHFEEICRFDNPNEAIDTWFHRSTNTDQSGETAISGPIITGLKKTAKLLKPPYDSYQLQFQNSLAINSRLLVCGYSFGDDHFNRFLGNFIEKNEGDMRVVIISYVSEQEWFPDMISNPDNPLQPLFHFLMSNSNMVEVNRNYPVQMPEKLEFDNAGLRVYLKGFKESVEDDGGEEILNYLTEDF